MGNWYITNYYSSHEDIDSFNCMKVTFSFVNGTNVNMNLTYSYASDPYHKLLLGNITWSVPDLLTSSHWIHTEENYDGFYDTYVIDIEYDSWLLLLHCAEKENKPRYLFGFIMSRSSAINITIVSYLKEKLGKYNIDLENVYDINQNVSICQHLTLNEHIMKFDYTVR